MRIAVYHNLSSGGAKRNLYETVQRISRRHVLDLFCPSTADQEFCDTRPFVQKTHVYPYQPGRWFSRPFGRFNPAVWLQDIWRMETLAKQVAYDIDRGRYDVVLVHPCRIIQAPSVLRYLRTPSIYYCHEPLRWLYDPPICRPYRPSGGYREAVNQLDPIRNLHRIVLGHLDRSNVRSACHLLTNSSYTRNSIARLYRVAAQVHRAGVDVDTFRPLGLSRRDRVVSLGALKPEKGFDFVIASLATIPSAERPGLDLVSNLAIPEEREYLGDLAHSSGVDVKFHIGIPTQDVVRLLATAALMVYAPVAEPLGLASLEAQACETPVIGVDEGGVPETMIDGLTGRVVSREPESFGKVVQLLIAAPSERAELGQSARKFVLQRWNWDSSAADLEMALAMVAGI